MKKQAKQVDNKPKFGNFGSNSHNKKASLSRKQQKEVDELQAEYMKILNVQKANGTKSDQYLPSF